MLVLQELMAFVLPGNARSLRFSAEAKAPSARPEAPGAAALGKPRERRPPPAPAPPPTAARGRKTSDPPASRGYDEAVDADDISEDKPTPYINSAHLAPMAQRRSPASAPPPYAAPSPGSRPAPPRGASLDHDDEDDEDDQLPTRAMDREVYERAAADRRHPPSVAPRAEAPHPHQAKANVRRSTPSEGTPAVSSRNVSTAPPANRARRSTAGRSGIPYAVWIFASILVGIVSFHVVPQVAARFDAPAPATEPAP